MMNRRGFLKLCGGILASIPFISKTEVADAVQQIEAPVAPPIPVAPKVELPSILQLGGIREGELIVISAPAGMGKTRMLKSLHDNFTRQGERTAYINIEDYLVRNKIPNIAKMTEGYKVILIDNIDMIAVPKKDSDLMVARASYITGLLQSIKYIINERNQIAICTTQLRRSPFKDEDVVAPLSVMYVPDRVYKITAYDNLTGNHTMVTLKNRWD